MKVALSLLTSWIGALFLGHWLAGGAHWFAVAGIALAAISVVFRIWILDDRITRLEGR